MFTQQKYIARALAHIKGNHLPEDLVALVVPVALFYLDLPKKGKVILLIHSNNENKQLHIHTTQQEQEMK